MKPFGHYNKNNYYDVLTFLLVSLFLLQEYQHGHESSVIIVGVHSFGIVYTLPVINTTRPRIGGGLNRAYDISLSLQLDKDQEHKEEDDQNSIDHKTSSRKYMTLPRLYVGEMNHDVKASTLVSSLFLNDTEEQPQQQIISSLQTKSKISLSLEQSHYLIKVMRIFKKKGRRNRFKNNNNVSTYDDENELDVSQCIRIFDGINGEWLARVIDPTTTTETHDTSSNKRSTGRRRGGGDNSSGGTLMLQAECLFPLRPQNDALSSSSSWLMFAPIKKQRLKNLIEKCSELGTSVFCPILTDHTDVSFDTFHLDKDNNNNNDTSFMMLKENKSSKTSELDKLPLVAREAAEQSERLNVPFFVTISDIILSTTESSTTTDEIDVGHHHESNELSATNNKYELESLLQTLDTSPLFKHTTLLVCRERKHGGGTLPLLQAFEQANRSGNVVFLVGAEGGWSEREEKLFDQYNAKYSDQLMMCVSLGSSVILRAETCAMAAVGAHALWIDCKNNKNE